MTNLITDIRTRLQGIYPTGEATAIARLLAEELFGLSQTDIYMGKDKDLSEHDMQKLENILVRLCNYEPVQYILGVAEFCGMRFEVNPHVLIPRPETAELIATILHDHPTPPSQVLDMGTGSGCIPITLAHHWPESEVHGWDISPEALDTARRNNLVHGTKVKFYQRDILKNDYTEGTAYDLIVSNPPYIRGCERADMERHVLDWEPQIALFVPDEDPLLFYRAIVQRATKGALRPGGWLYFEINREYGAETAALLTAQGFTEVEVIKDSYGNERIVKGKWGIFTPE